MPAVRNSLPSGVLCISGDIFGDCMENARENQHDFHYANSDVELPFNIYSICRL